MTKPSLSLYIHVPFCYSKCTYCDFISVPIGCPNQRSPKSDGLIEAYFKGIHQEIESYKEEIGHYQIHSIFFGGGTPSAVNASYIASVLDHVKVITDLEEGAEITLEANPGTLTDEKIAIYKKAGVNRVSMGFQTSSNRLLKEIGRIHTLSDFEVAYARLMKAGIDNISMDIMFGLPGQTMADIDHTMALVEKINPKHISAYALKLEEGTPMYRDEAAGRISLPDESLERDMYHAIISKLKTLQLDQYEISNFAHKGFESRHNLVYWHNQAYLGLGVSAHSKMNGQRFANTSALTQYIDQQEKGQSSVVTHDLIDEKEDLFESIILGLRLNEGLRVEALNRRYGIDFMVKYEEDLESLKALDLIEVFDHQVIRLTTKGFDLSNQVFLAFYPEED